MHYPLHVKTEIPNMDLDKIKYWMRNDARYRFEQVISKMLCTRISPQPEPPVRGNLHWSDIKDLLAAKVIERVPDEISRKIPTIQYLVPFTVLEADESGKLRRRFISWTRDDNERLKN